MSREYLKPEMENMSKAHDFLVSMRQNFVGTTHQFWTRFRAETWMAFAMGTHNLHF